VRIGQQPNWNYDGTGRQRRLRPEEREKFVAQARALRAQGATLAGIADALGFSEPTVYLWVKDTPHPDALRRAARDALIAELHQAGHSAREIARRLDAKPNNIWRVLRCQRSDKNAMATRRKTAEDTASTAKAEQEKQAEQQREQEKQAEQEKQEQREQREPGNPLDPRTGEYVGD